MARVGVYAPGGKHLILDDPDDGDSREGSGVPEVASSAC